MLLGTRVAWALGNHPASAWMPGGERSTNAGPTLLATFSRPLPRCSPCSSRPALLHFPCSEDPTSQEGSVLSGLCIDIHSPRNRQGREKPPILLCGGEK